MTETVLGLVDNLGMSYGQALSFAIAIGAGFAIGSMVWFIWGPGHPVAPNPGGPWVEQADRKDQMAGMTVSDFFFRVTLHTTQGRLFLWLSAANLALAAALPFLDQRIAAHPIGPVLWFYPLFLFIYHIASFWKFGSSWFSLVMLSAMAILPAWKIFVVDLFGLR